ncbi:hypothetical protein [Amorphus orientalis]|uniref:Cbb3-type cytochrome oxidase subunit 1 n=1 Tax=Amorphus orientalis TaxID=649198 RepID=A0AAE3VN83_9HYPH|nr:hypothetical protein [Amorphus orientalis]MDQ0315065.1 cbb3-type cytochrome oxidase subunit 1 [Amorphus orientalis]
MRASSLALPAAVAMALIGMVWGIAMAISHDHSTMPAHAHLNLLGWVSLFLMGIFYRLHPELDRGRLAFIQVAVWIVASFVMIVGVALVHTGNRVGDPVAGLSSIVVVADMLLFAGFVVRALREPADDARERPVSGAVR